MIHTSIKLGNERKIEKYTIFILNQSQLLNIN